MTCSPARPSGCRIHRRRVGLMGALNLLRQGAVCEGVPRTCHDDDLHAVQIPVLRLNVGSGDSVTSAPQTVFRVVLVVTILIAATGLTLLAVGLNGAITFGSLTLTLNDTSKPLTWGIL